MPQAARLAARLFDTPLLLRPETAELIASSLAERWGVEPMLADQDITRALGLVRGERASFDSAELDDAPYTVADGVATIAVHGELVNRGSFMNSLSGLTSYDALGQALNAAKADPSVRAILLDMDSPGGEAAGAMETAALVRSISKDKTVAAFVNSTAASAAYAIASGADHIVALPSATLGSIGVVLLHLDRSQAMKERGVKPTLIHAGAYKVDGNPYAALPDEARSRLQARVDEIYGLFVSTVAAHRSLDAADVRKTEAGVFLGESAVKAGLADQLGGLEDARSYLTRRVSGSRKPQGVFMSASNNGGTGAENPVSYTQAQLDAAVQSASERVAVAAQAASATAATAEQARISAIVDHAEGKDRPTAARQLAFRTRMSAEEAGAFLAGLPKEAAAGHVSTKQSLLAAAAPNPHIPTGDAAPSASEGAPWEKVVAKLCKSQNLQMRGH